MFARVVCVAFTLSVTSVARKPLRERKSAYKAALKCTEAGWNASVSAVLAGEDRGEKKGCIFLRVRFFRFVNCYPLGSASSHGCFGTEPQSWVYIGK